MGRRPLGGQHRLQDLDEPGFLGRGHSLKCSRTFFRCPPLVVNRGQLRRCQQHRKPPGSRTESDGSCSRASALRSGRTRSPNRPAWRRSPVRRPWSRCRCWRPSSWRQRVEDGGPHRQVDRAGVLRARAERRARHPRLEHLTVRVRAVPFDPGPVRQPGCRHPRNTAADARRRRHRRTPV